jgi:hypothetical protein
VGGKGVDLRLIEIENGKPVWTAKNVPNDFLDMPVPGTLSCCRYCLSTASLSVHSLTLAVCSARATVWVSDIGFLPDDPRRVAVVTGYHQIRVYDVKYASAPACIRVCVCVCVRASAAVVDSSHP